MTYSGTVKDGVIVLENGTALPEGASVRVEVVEASSEGSSLLTGLEALAGKAVGLPSDLARNHDYYLHGLPRR